MSFFGLIGASLGVLPALAMKKKKKKCVLGYAMRFHPMHNSFITTKNFEPAPEPTKLEPSLEFRV